jgi:NADPH2:quinone reductase
MGFAGGRIPEITVNRVPLKDISIIGLLWYPYKQHKPQLIATSQEKLYEWYTQNRIKPVVLGEFRFDQLSEALQLVEDRKCYGKLIFFFQ